MRGLLSGSDWGIARDARFDIVANVPEGAAKDQAREMLLNLLKELLHLTYHTEKKDFDMYTLVVAKGGSKLKDAAPANGPAPELPGAVPRDRDEFPILPPGRTTYRGASNNG